MADAAAEHEVFCDATEEGIGAILCRRYRLDRILEDGAYGIVYRAFDMERGRPVAIKVLREDLSEDRPEALERVLADTCAVAELEHPNVRALLDLRRDEEEAVFQVLEPLEGETFEALLRREGTLSIERAVAILRPVLEALAAAHEVGVVHGDLRPANIFLSRARGGEAVPKLQHFGFAELVGQERALSTAATAHEPWCMAPEQAVAEKKVTPATDVWAVGAILFRCLTGFRPYPGRDPMQVAVGILTEPPPCVAKALPELHPEIAEVIQGALTKDPKERIEGARSLRRCLDWALERAQGPEASAKMRSAKTQSEPRPRASIEIDLADLDRGRLSDCPTQEIGPLRVSSDRITLERAGGAL